MGHSQATTLEVGQQMILDETDAASLDYLFSEPHKYLLIATKINEKVESVEKYMYGISIVTELCSSNRMSFFLAIVRKDWAQSTVDRLASGLYGASLHDSWKEAYDRLLELA